MIRTFHRRSMIRGAVASIASLPFANTIAGACGEPGTAICDPFLERILSSTGESMTETVSGRFEPGFCLNTSTIHGETIDLVRQIEIASKAGYTGIEPWLRDIRRFEESGGKLSELAKRLSDGGLVVEDAIAFAPWIVDDDAQRSKGLEQAKRDMDTVRQLGGRRIAAPPAGAVDGERLNLDAIADRYHSLLQLGVQSECIPQLEVWGFAKNLSRIQEVVYVACACGHEQARILPDVYHLYKGGSPFEALGMIAGNRIEVFHMNDYPAFPVRENITDADRVYPGEGIAPLASVLGTLKRSGFQGTLSLELFNRTYWGQDPLEVAVTGLKKMREAVDRLAIS